MSNLVVLPLTLISYNGGCQHDEFSIQNSIDTPTGDDFENERPHCSQEGNNYDLLLRYKPLHPTSGSDACTLTHLVIRQPANCSDPLSSGVLFVSSDELPPAVERYASLYTDCTSQRFDDTAVAVRSEHGAVCYFDVGMAAQQTVLTIPPEQGKCVRFIHLRLIRGGDSNIDLGRIAAVGFSYPSVDTPPPVISLYQPMLEQLKLAPKRWQPGCVQPFHTHFQQLLMDTPFVLIHYGNNQDDAARVNAANLASILDSLAASQPTTAYFTIDQHILDTVPCATALRTIASWGEEEEYDGSEARIVFCHFPSKSKRMVDRVATATLPETEMAQRERMLMFTAWMLACSDMMNEQEQEEQGQVKQLVSLSSGQQEEQHDPELDNPFIATLLQFAEQAAGGMMIGLLAVKQCTSVTQYKAALSSDDTFDILQQLMLNYWNTNWAKLNNSQPADEPEYVDEVYGEMISTGPFQHLTCLNMFLWEYTVNLLRESVQAMLRSAMALSNTVHTWQEFKDCVRALIYNMVRRTNPALTHSSQLDADTA